MVSQEEIVNPFGAQATLEHAAGHVTATVHHDAGVAEAEVPAWPRPFYARLGRGLPVPGGSLAFRASGNTC